MGRRTRQIAMSLEKTLLGALAFLASSQPILAQTADQLAVLQGLRESHDIIGLSLVVGLVLFSTITALLHLAGRQSWTRRENGLSLELAHIRAKLDRAEVFLAAERQIIIAWDTA